MAPTDLLKAKTPVEQKNNQPSEPAKELRPAQRSHPWRRIIIVAVLAILVFAGLLGYRVYRIGTAITAPTTDMSFYQQIKSLIVPSERPLRGEEEGRINVLLLGFGGAGHQGAYLSDTIIVASLNPQTKEVALMSIPRDLYVEIPGYGYRKINNAFAFGHMEKDVTDGGEALAQATVQQVLGIPIHYYAWLDFSGFEKIVDDIGGIDVTIDQSFVDYTYPTLDYGYQTVRFTEGQQTMDGDTALKYVRSRHGTNGEGSDFARSKRQQKVIMAVKEKLLSFGTLTNPTRISSVLDDLTSHTKTNFQIWEISKVAKMFEAISGDKISSHVIDNSKDGLLVSKHTEDGAYILSPKSGNFSEIQYFAQNIFNLSSIQKENAEIAVLNGTKTTGLGRSTADDLEALQYTVTKVDSTANQPATVIYDLSNGANPETAAALKDKFRSRVETQLPQSLQKLFTSETLPDIIIVLGEDMVPAKPTGGSVV